MSKQGFTNTKQEEILQEIARKHGLNILQAREIFNLLGSKIAEIISNPDKKIDGLYNSDKFDIIHIDNFGKFIPNQKKIRHANYCLTNLKKTNNDNDDKTDEHNV